ncbi:DnaA N-terminal domain-containing protein [Sporomusa sphaeroides]|uniref:DnaA N-terminal domain-containing protein n=1 Tax=Sporomusa sphaeroides TaxID=47679 RepID=UPI002CF5C599|nr:DnaA N-terminal domain-containing protein [Sporomusa sphaeroides]HML34253.1 DnaA N-terminal domain-containing protein [Sporomusa sphaeroides]
MAQIAAQSDLTLLWHQILQDLKKEMIKPLFDTWITNIVPIELNDSDLIVGTPKQFVKEWLEGRYNELLKDFVTKYTGKDLNIVYVNLDTALPIPEKSELRPLTQIEKLLRDFQGLTSEKQKKVIEFVEALQTMD